MGLLLSEFEQDLFEWFKRTYQDKNLQLQLSKAQITDRDYTIKGMYLNFKIDNELDACHLQSPIEGPHIISKDIQYGALCLLWLNEGYINSIELAAYGDFFPEVVRDYQFEKVDNRLTKL